MLTALTTAKELGMAKPSVGSRSSFVALPPGVWTTVSLVVNNPAEATPGFDGRDVIGVFIWLQPATLADFRGHLDTIVIE